MKPFLQKFAIMLTVILLFLGGMEGYLRYNDDSKLARKRDYFHANAERLEGLIFGSSHGMRAIDAGGLTPLTANLSLTAGDLTAAANLCFKTLEKANPKFILFELPPMYLEHERQESWYEKRRIFHYFGFKQGRRSLKDYFLVRHPAYRIFFYSPPDEGYTETGFATEIPVRHDKFAEVGYEETEIARLRYTVTRIKGHNEIIDDEVYARTTALLRKLLAEAATRGITVIFYDTPKYQLYNEATNPVLLERRQAFLDEVVNGTTVRWWDLSRFNEENAELFYNVTHLNVAGARLFTAEIDRRLEGI